MGQLMRRVLMSAGLGLAAASSIWKDFWQPTFAITTIDIQFLMIDLI